MKWDGAAAAAGEPRFKLAQIRGEAVEKGACDGVESKAVICGVLGLKLVKKNIHNNASLLMSG